MFRQIIKIDAEKCNGCGLCAEACHEGAIGMVDGKACLLRDDYCDGLGHCLPVCPTSAISFEQREAAGYDEAAVQANIIVKQQTGSCPGSMAKTIHTASTIVNSNTVENERSALRQWPVQIKLVPVNAPYFQGANLLLAADCSAFAYRNFHDKFMKNRVTLIGCPKLDEGDYSEKLIEILRINDINSVTVARMEVPCCGGLEQAARAALKASGKLIPLQVVIISIDGTVIN